MIPKNASSYAKTAATFIGVVVGSEILHHLYMKEAQRLRKIGLRKKTIDQMVHASNMYLVQELQADDFTFEEYTQKLQNEKEFQEIVRNLMTD